ELNGSNGNVRSFTLMPQGDVLYFGARSGSNFQLYRQPADGSAAPIALTSFTAANANVGEFTLTAAGATVGCAATPDPTMPLVTGLFRVPSDGSAAPIQIGPGGGSLLLTPDGSRAVYIAGASASPRTLFSVPTDGSAAPIQLSQTLGHG